MIHLKERKKYKMKGLRRSARLQKDRKEEALLVPLRRSSRLQKRNQKRRLEDETGEMFLLPLGKKNKTIHWEEWVAATATKNYILDDGFLDILSTKSSSAIKANPLYSEEIGKSLRLSTNTKGFVPSLLEAGNSFEAKVIKFLTKDFGAKNVQDIGGNRAPRSDTKYEETISAIQKGVPCIFQGILRNYSNKTYGVVDVLIRSDWINKFLDVNALSIDETKVSAPKLKTKYHYVVIDIKYKSLPLRADGVHLLNDGNIKAYKSQLWVYNDALGKIQGYTPPYTFILGSKWKFTSCGATFEGNSCFDRLGRIDYSFLDKEYIDKTKKAVKWLNEVQKKGDKWDLSKYPLPRDELYPNMCNRYDYPYHGIKKMFAETNKDLTLIWNVGAKHRREANKEGVYSWDDPKCNSKILGVSGEFKPKVIDRILEANHSEGRTIYPKYIANNLFDWKNEEGRKIELFVDFETTCSVFQEMDDSPENRGTALIFLIGVGYISPETEKWEFKEFVVDQINEKEELRICFDFISFVKSLKRKYKIRKELPLYHFSHAEPSSWRRVFERNGRKNVSLNWRDLLKVFLEEPIGVKGCLSYSLKTLAKNFYKHGYISTIWDTENPMADGADAAVGAYQANLECLAGKTSFGDHSLVKDIIKYNEVDCKVLEEILSYLRENHVQKID